MLLEPGPLAPIDEQQIAQQLGADIFGDVPQPAIDLAVILDGEAGGVEASRDVIVEAGEPYFRDLDTGEIEDLAANTVVIDAQAQQEPGEELPAALDAAESMIDDVVTETAGDSGPQQLDPRAQPADYIPDDGPRPPQN